MASDPSEIIPAAQMDEVFRPAPPFASARVVAVALGPAGQKPTNVATASLVTIRGRNLLVTAKHVVEDSCGDPRPCSILAPARDADSKLRDGWWARPARIELGADDVIWRSRDLDVAILRAPVGLNVETFDGDSAVEIAAKVAQTWEEHAALDAFRPVVVSGFPSFARDVGEVRGDYALVSLPGFVTGANGTGTNLVLDLGCTEVRPNAFDDSKRAIFERQLSTRTQGFEPLGGLSGAPAVVITDRGIFLLGVVSKGSQATGRGFVVAWHAIHAEFSESLPPEK